MPFLLLQEQIKQQIMSLLNLYMMRQVDQPHALHDLALQALFARHMAGHITIDTQLQFLPCADGCSFISRVNGARGQLLDPCFREQAAIVIVTTAATRPPWRPTC